MKKKLFLISSIFFFSIFIIVINIKAQTPFVGQFTTQNTAPQIPRDIMVQQLAVSSLDGTTGKLIDFDHWDYIDTFQTNPADIAGMNTHMVYNSTPKPIIMWNASIDLENDVVESLLCIGTDETAVSTITTASLQATIDAVCDIVGGTTTGNQFKKGTSPGPWFGILPSGAARNAKETQFQFVGTYVTGVLGEQNFYYGKGGTTPNKFGVKIYGHERTTGDLVSPGYYSEIDLVNSKPYHPYNFTTLDIVQGNLLNENFNFTHHVQPKIGWNLTGQTEVGTLGPPHPGLSNTPPDFDPDNGTWADHYPADVVTFYINISGPTGTGTIRDYLDPTVAKIDNSLIYAGTWENVLDWPTQAQLGIDGYAMRNYTYIIDAHDYVTTNIANDTNNFSISDFIPEVKAVDLANDISVGPNPPVGDVLHRLCDTRVGGAFPGCTIVPTQKDLVQNMNFTIVVFDKDNDCDLPQTGLLPQTAAPKNFSAVLNFCNYTTPPGAPASCSSTTASFMFKSNRVVTNNSGAPRFYSSTCNFTLTTTPLSGLAQPTLNLKGTPPFFVRVADPSVYGTPAFFLWANVTSHSGLMRANLLEFQWRYAGLSSVQLQTRTFTILDTITNKLKLGGQSSVTLGSWNLGTAADDEYNISNYGNLVTDLRWSSTNPTCVSGSCLGPPDVWVLGTINTNLNIDDDNNLGGIDPSQEPTPVFKTGGLTSVSLTGTPQNFNPTNGLRRCIGTNTPNPLLNPLCVDALTVPAATDPSILPTFWPIRPPVGLRPGTYESTITYAVDVATRWSVQPQTLT